MSVSSTAGELPSDHECDKMSRQAIRLIDAEGTIAA